MTSLIFSVIVALSPIGDAQDTQVVAAKVKNAVEEQWVEPKFDEPEKTRRHFHRLLKNGDLTLPGIVIEDLSTKPD